MLAPISHRLLTVLWAECFPTTKAQVFFLEKRSWKSSWSVCLWETEERPYFSGRTYAQLAELHMHVLETLGYELVTHLSLYTKLLGRQLLFLPGKWHCHKQSCLKTASTDSEDSWAISEVGDICLEISMFWTFKNSVLTFHSLVYCVMSNCTPRLLSSLLSTSMYSWWATHTEIIPSHIIHITCTVRGAARSLLWFQILIQKKSFSTLPAA